jgi:plastocyanin
MKVKALGIAAIALGLCCQTGWAYESETVTDGGTITGQVKYQGTAPAPKPIDVTKDKEVCGVTPKVEENLLVSKDGGIKNAVVYLTNISKGKPMPTGKAVFDQKGCRYQPHVLAFPAGSTVEIKNDDGILHNIHTYGKKNPPMNRAQPKFKKVIEEKFDQPEIFEVRCDAHGWMNGWFVVEDNPYYAVTDDNGMYKLTDVPPGQYEIKVWQEKLGDKTQTVTVTAKGETKANFEFAAK